MNSARDKKICVIGVSHKADKFGYRIFVDLVKAGFDVTGINPTDGEIAGRKIYRSLAELPEKPDLLITVTPHQATERIVGEAQALGIPEIWMQPGSESEEAVRKAQEHGMRVVHNACFMKETGLW